MNEILLTITQALQLVALAPSIFVIAFLICASHRNADNIVPILYFLALGCTFVTPLLPIFAEIGESASLQGALMLGESLVPALSFLLIIQFLRGQIPPPLFWLILLIPLVGGMPFIYLALQGNEVCLDNVRCVAADDLQTLYDVFGSALIFLLLIVQFVRSTGRIAVDDADRAHKYWLIIALIVLNLCVMLIDLLRLSETIQSTDAILGVTILRIGFLYLALTSIFRLFYDIFEVHVTEPANVKNAIKTAEHDKRIVEQLRDLLENQHIYREMGLSREGLAKQLGISEHRASHIVNTYFHKNFNELINEYRIREAKHRLLTEETQITVIAYDVGFNSIASFNRVFKEITGTSPSAFRSFHANNQVTDTGNAV